MDVPDANIIKQRDALRDLAFWFSDLGVNKELDVSDPLELCDGRAFAELLNIIDPKYFDKDWLETIPQVISKNSIVVKRSCLRKIWRKVSEYITVKLNRGIATNRWKSIDVRVDGMEETDLPVAIDFSILIVTLAHLGPNKADFVQYSTKKAQENKSAMENVASLISTGMKELPESNSCDNNEATHSEFEEINEVNIELSNPDLDSNGTGGRVSISDNRLMDSLYTQVENLESQNAKLLEKIGHLGRELESAQLLSDGGKSGTGDSSVISTLEQMNEELKVKRRDAEEKVNELEGQLESLRPTLKTLTMENEELKLMQKEMSSMKSELQSARDDLEIWRGKAEKAAVESDATKKKDRELKELHQQIKVLQSRLDHHVKQSTVDEENKTSVMTLRQNIGTLKGELETKDMELISKEQMIRNLEDNLIALKEKYKALDDRKEDLIAEKNALEEKLLKASENVTEKSLHCSIRDAGNNSTDFISAERIGVLEMENKRLMDQIRDLESLEVLNGEVITLKNRNSQLEQEAQLAIKQKETMSAEIEELQRKIEENQKNMINDMSDLKVQLERGNLDKQVAEERAEKAEAKLQNIEDLLKRKTEENTALELSLNKARTIINDLEEKSQPVGDETGTSVQQYKQLRQEKEILEKKVRNLESELKTITTTYEEENRLLTSAAHNMICVRNEDRMIMESGRAQGGADAPSSSQSPILSHKMKTSIAWSHVVFLMTGMMVLIFMISSLISAIQAPPDA